MSSNYSHVFFLEVLDTHLLHWKMIVFHNLMRISHFLSDEGTRS